MILQRLHMTPRRRGLRATPSIEDLEKTLEEMSDDAFGELISGVAAEVPEFDRWLDAEVSVHPKDGYKISRARRKQIVDLGLVATLRSGMEHKDTPTHTRPQSGMPAIAPMASWSMYPLWRPMTMITRPPRSTLPSTMAPPGRPDLPKPCRRIGLHH